MPEITDEMHNNRLRVIVKIKPGERVKLCRCMASKRTHFATVRTKTPKHLMGLLSSRGLRPTRTRHLPPLNKPAANTFANRSHLKQPTLELSEAANKIASAHSMARLQTIPGQSEPPPG
jgi:hypothetical protein